jgi:hypothetical protein
MAMGDEGLEQVAETSIISLDPQARSAESGAMTANSNPMHTALVAVVEAWPSLSVETRERILAMVSRT